MVVDPRTLSSFRLGTVEGDVACVTCGYNLRGLPSGGKCPECGGPVSASLGRGRFLFRNLTDAPIGYLKVLRLGCFLLAISVVALFGAIILAGWLQGVAAAGLVAGVGILWWSGVYLATSSEYPPGGDLSHKYNRLRWLRWTNRVLQVAWSVAWACAALEEVLVARQNLAIASAGNPAVFQPYIDAAGMAGWIMQLLGLVSLVPLCIHFAEIANAAGNDGLATRLGLAAWGIALFGAYAVVWYVFHRSVGVLGFGVPVVGLGMLISLGLFVYSLIELAIMCGWAVANSRAVVARERRLHEKAEAHEAAVQARLAALPVVPVYQQNTVGSLVDESPIPLEPER